MDFYQPETLELVTMPKGERVREVRIEELPYTLRRTHRHRSSMLDDDQVLVAVEYLGAMRWVKAPEDVQVELASTPGLLRRGSRVCQDHDGEGGT
jgi:hypothetical protein